MAQYATEKKLGELIWSSDEADLYLNEYSRLSIVMRCTSDWSATNRSLINDFQGKYNQHLKSDDGKFAGWIFKRKYLQEIIEELTKLTMPAKSATKRTRRRINRPHDQATEPDHDEMSPQESKPPQYSDIASDDSIYDATTMTFSHTDTKPIQATLIILEDYGVPEKVRCLLPEYYNLLPVKLMRRHSAKLISETLEDEPDWTHFIDDIQAYLADNSNSNSEVDELRQQLKNVEAKFTYLKKAVDRMNPGLSDMLLNNPNQ